MRHGLKSLLLKSVWICFTQLSENQSSSCSLIKQRHQIALNKDFTLRKSNLNLASWCSAPNTLVSVSYHHIIDILAIFSPREPDFSAFTCRSGSTTSVKSWKLVPGFVPILSQAEVLTNRWCLPDTKLGIPNLDLMLGNQLGEAPLRIIRMAVWP